MIDLHLRIAYVSHSNLIFVISQYLLTIQQVLQSFMEYQTPPYSLILIFLHSIYFTDAILVRSALFYLSCSICILYTGICIIQICLSCFLRSTLHCSNFVVLCIFGLWTVLLFYRSDESSLETGNANATNRSLENCEKRGGCGDCSADHYGLRTPMILSSQGQSGTSPPQRQHPSELIMLLETDASAHTTNRHAHPVPPNELSDARSTNASAYRQVIFKRKFIS